MSDEGIQQFAVKYNEKYHKDIGCSWWYVLQNFKQFTLTAIYSLSAPTGRRPVHASPGIAGLGIQLPSRLEGSFDEHSRFF